MSMTSASIDLLCEILAGIGSNNAMQQEAVVRWSKLFFGNITEPLIQVLMQRTSIIRFGFSSIYSINFLHFSVAHCTGVRVPEQSVALLQRADRQY